MSLAADFRTVARILLAGTCILLGAEGIRAQEGPRTLSLEEALELALRNNPEFLAQRNLETSADWAVREAYGSLLPGASVSSGFQYQGAGASRFGIFTAEDVGVGQTPAYYLSDYSLNLNYGLSGADLFRIRQEQAGRMATLAESDAAGFTLRSAVTRQYLAVLRARDAVELARQQMERAEENLKLANARVEVGAAIPLEAIQAEVERGRAEVELVRAESTVRGQRHVLGEQLGVPLPADVELTSEFPIFQPRWSEDELLEFALAENPVLRASEAREEAAEASVRMARSTYLPRLDVNVGWSGFTRQASDTDYLVNQARDQFAGQRETCQFFNSIANRLTEPLPGFPADCAQLVLTPDREQRIRSSNEVFPFDFTRQPVQARLQVSLPIFQGFSRQRQVETARVQSRNARHLRRAEELGIRTQVASAHDNLMTSARVVRLEERNQQGADEQLRLARERYRLGAASFIELLEAETIKAQADRSYLQAQYDFHEALAALESAVGRRLSP